MPAILSVTLNPAIDVYTSVPELAPTHKLRCRAERRDPGGGGINVARVIARLGGDVEVVFPSGGAIGALLQSLIEEEGLSAHVVAITGTTRESFTVLEDASQNEYRFVLPGPVLSPPEFEACCAAILNTSSRYVVASGSLPSGLGADTYARLAARVKQHGAKFVLDASGDALRQALNQGVYLVKPNVSEMQAISQTPLTSEADLAGAARALIDAGKAEIVAISRGADGALLATHDEVWIGDAIKAPIKSSVGAGDSFLASLVWSLERRESVDTALRYALAAGAATLLQPGTSLARQADIERLAPLASLRKL